MIFALERGSTTSLQLWMWQVKLWIINIKLSHFIEDASQSGIPLASIDA